MKVFWQVFIAVLLATGITFGTSLYVLHQEAADFKRTISESVVGVKSAITDFRIFGKKK